MNFFSKQMKVNKTVFSVFVLLTAYCSLLTSPVFAHVLLTDNNIGAVVHIDPADDPIVGQPASFFFELKDKQNKFNPIQCDCTFVIEQNGKQLYSADLYAGISNPGLDSGAAFYTFKDKGVYKISVTGNPKPGTDFQSFTLTEDLRVERISTNQTASSSNLFITHWLHFIVFGAGFVILIVLVFVNRKKPS